MEGGKEVRREAALDRSETTTQVHRGLRRPRVAVVTPLV